MAAAAPSTRRQAAADQPGPHDPNTAPAAQAPTSDGLYTLRWIAAWVVFLAVAAVLNRTRLGHAVIYHLLVLATVLLLAGQYRKFAQIEEPISGVHVP